MIITVLSGGRSRRCRPEPAKSGGLGAYMGDGRLIAQSGRQAEIRLMGKRMWKNPRVRLGNQWHDEVEALPDMKGSIAKFYCVAQLNDARYDSVEWRSEKRMDIEPKNKPAAFKDEQKGGGQNNRQGSGQNPPPEQRLTRVWTSEGATGFVSVEVRAFRPGYLRNGSTKHRAGPIGRPKHHAGRGPTPKSLIQKGMGRKIDAKEPKGSPGHWGLSGFCSDLFRAIFAMKETRHGPKKQRRVLT